MNENAFDLKRHVKVVKRLDRDYKKVLGILLLLVEEDMKVGYGWPIAGDFCSYWNRRYAMVLKFLHTKGFVKIIRSNGAWVEAKKCKPDDWDYYIQTCVSKNKEN